MESARVLQRTHLVGPNALKFWREHDLFLDHAPAVIAISLPAPPRTAPAPTPSRAGPTPTRSGKAPTHTLAPRTTRRQPAYVYFEMTTVNYFAGF